MTWAHPRSAPCEGQELVRSGRVAQLLQSLGFDLTDTFAGYAERPAYLSERGVGHPHPEPHPQNALLAGGQLSQDLRHAVSKRGSLHRGVRIDSVGCLDEIGKGGIAMLAGWVIERSGVLHQRQRLFDLSLCNARACSNLVGLWLAPMLLMKFAPLAMNLPCGSRHVPGDANHAALVGHGTRDRLPDPPNGIGRELDATPIVVLLDRTHETEIAFLDKIGKLQGAVTSILLGDGNHETEMRAHHLLTQPLLLSPRLVDLRKGKTPLRQRQAQPPGYSLEVCTKFGQTLRMRLHKSAPASVG